MEDPTDLHEDPTLLNKLREKLCILWGDLEERKRDEEEEAEEKSRQRVAKRPRLADDHSTEEDRDQKLLSNLPFNCCLEEYGSLREGGDSENIADWGREFMMLGVTIN